MSSLDLLSTILYHCVIGIRLIYTLVFNGSTYRVKPCNVGENETSSGENEDAKIRGETSLYSIQGRLGKNVFGCPLCDSPLLFDEILKKYKE